MYAESIKAKGGPMDERTRFMLEVYVPTFSVSALLGITAYVASEAVSVLLYSEEDDDVDVNFLYGFAVSNFFIDIVSSFLFYLLGKNALVATEVSAVSVDNDSKVMLCNMDNFDNRSTFSIVKKKKVNLNMMSALTHVGGDTLRTFSVLFAAIVSSFTSISSSTCDAWAAVVVSVTILIALAPLIREIYRAAIRNPNEDS